MDPSPLLPALDTAGAKLEPWELQSYAPRLGSHSPHISGKPPKRLKGRQFKVRSPDLPLLPMLLWENYSAPLNLHVLAGTMETGTHGASHYGNWRW